MEKVAGYIDVSEVAQETGFGLFGCSVGIDKRVWSECVEWNETDNTIQDYQEEDARLWDILFVGGSKLQMNPNEILRNTFVKFQIYCLPRDGKSIESIIVNFKIEMVMLNGVHGLLIRYDE